MADIQSETNRHKKRCRTCGEEIVESAQKCIHCDAYQDWRRYLAFSSTVLALLVALLSVATVAGPVFRDLVITKDSKLVASFQGFSDGQAVFVVSNSGSRPGTVGEAFVVLAQLQPSAQDMLNFFLLSDLPLAPKHREESSFIDAGQSRLLKYQLRSGTKQPWENTDITTFGCAIGIELINFSGYINKSCFKYKCNRMVQTLFPDSQPREFQEGHGQAIEGQAIEWLVQGLCRPASRVQEQ
jgi:hypothetical protein